ncbi:MAG: RpiB/LacA/LacB family sugar-phosphate isomerase [Candidatus Babeliales bacterium]
MKKNKNLNLVIATDHRGYAMKEFLKATVNLSPYILSWIDVGAFDDERSDYPEFAIPAIEQMRSDKADYGILLCGTGIGMAIIANRYPGIYAGLAWNKQIAQESKEDDNTNVLALPSDYVTNEQAQEMVEVWLNTEFKKGRYQKRIDMIDAIEI